MKSMGGVETVVEGTGDNLIFIEYCLLILATSVKLT